MANWSELPHEMLVIIAELFKSPKDFVQFGAVCKSWQAAADKEYLKRLCLRQGIPYLMLPVRDDNGEARELYSLIQNKVVDPVKVPNFKRKKCLESLGWLLATDVDGSMNLVEPFSGMEIQLPHQKTFPDYYSLDEHVFVQKMVLSARPNETSDFVLMAICGQDALLTFWRVGDKAWNRIDNRREGVFVDVVYHNGQFYAICHPGVVWLINIEPHDNRAEAIMIARFIHDLPYPPHPLILCKTLYVLKTCDCLYVITRTQPDLCSGELPDDEPRFHVYAVDASTYPGIIKEIHSLGTMAVFLGHNATTAFDTSKSHGIIKPNHIYFSDDNWQFYYFDDAGEGGGRDMGVYSLDTREVELFYHGELLLSKVSPSTWINPYLPQFT